MTSESDQTRTRDQMLKRMLKSPPKPHADHAKKRKESRTPPAKDRSE